MNIHHVLSRITAGDYEFFQSMTEEELKEIQPYVIALWLRGAYEDRWAHVIMTDTFLNTKLFSLSRHPKLLLMLATYANSGMGDTRYEFRKDERETKKKTTNLIMREFSCNETAARLYEKFLSEEDIKELEAKYEEVDK